MSNKFMVIKLKELIRTIVFAVLGVIIIVCLVYFAAGKFSNATALYNPGVYTSEIKIENGKADVQVRVDKRKIVAVNIIDKSQSLPVFYPLFETVGEEIAQNIIDEQTSNIEITDSSVTANVILSAVEESLAQARK